MSLCRSLIFTVLCLLAVVHLIAGIPLASSHNAAKSPRSRIPIIDAEAPEYQKIADGKRRPHDTRHFHHLAQSTTTTNQHSLNAILTPHSISYLQSIFEPIIIQQIQEIQLQDISQQIDTPIGHLDITLSDMKLNQFQLGEIQVSIQQQQQGVQVTVSQAFAALNLNWKYRRSHAPHVSDHGTASASVGSNVQLLMQATVIPNGNSTTLQVSVPQFNLQIEKFDLKMHGGASWLYNIFISSFKSAIVHSIEQSVHENVAQIIQQEASKVLSTLNLNFVLSEGLSADFSFTNVEFQSTGMISEHLALIKASGHDTFSEAPPTLPSIYAPKSSDMVQLMIADTLLNSAGYSIQQLNLIRYVIGNGLLPSWSPFKLNTAAFCLFIPKVCSLYPVSKDMQIALVSATAPRMKIDPSVGVELILDLAAQFQVLNGSSSSTDTLFSIDAAIVLDSSISVENGTTLVASFSKKNMTISLKDSEVGQFDMSMLSLFMNSITDYILIPLVNAVGSKGLELPSVEGLTLVDPSVSILERILVVSSNYKYVPPSSFSRLKR